MAVGFEQVEERVYTIKVTARESDYIWDNERIQAAKKRLGREFAEFESLLEDAAINIEILSVTRGPSRTI